MDSDVHEPGRMEGAMNKQKKSGGGGNSDGERQSSGPESDRAAEELTESAIERMLESSGDQTGIEEVSDALEKDASDVDGTPLPESLPVLPVRNVVVFPGTVVPLSVGREKAKRLIDAVFAGDRLLVVAAQRHEDTEDPGIDEVYRIGTACRALKLFKLPDGNRSILVHGLVRVGMEEFTAKEPYWIATVTPRPDTTQSSIEVEAMVYSSRQLAEQVIDLSPNVPDEAKVILSNIEKPGALADFLSANLSLGLVQKQELLETFDVVDRLRKVNATLNNQLEVLQLSQKIQTDVKSQIDKTQREYFLHEQMKAIQKELGEGDSSAAEVQELSEKVARAKMPEAVMKEAQRELGRLERIPQASPERGVIRDYLDWLCEMPWTTQSQDNLDLDLAQRVLDEDHYGLEKIKRRIVEYLAVRKLKPEGKGPILCFAGPPGVGKTSLGQSIARALGRKFIRIALGGVRDEADIRGHRRTYIGAMPGRLVQEIRKAGTRNPLIMLDEMDKIGSDFRGDPASALLEVLDPAQNHSFTDHYLGVPFDLSKAIFIGTANYMDPVAPALKDRMEVIELPGYTRFEKLQIARRHLLVRQLAENGLEQSGIQFTDEALAAIIDGHTRESGVRNLERLIGTVLRGVAARVARGEKPPKRIKPEMLDEPLGPPRFDSEMAQRTSVAGVATGLAYTPVGGEIIFVEATRMEGSGAFVLTGQIGDVMRESAQAAMSLVRSRAQSWGMKLGPTNRMDIHVHVPAGGVPKDGPSAGVTMVTSLVSLLSDKPADVSVAMTGEITLRGLVMPIGGVKEKVLAAHRAGIKTVILPERNRRDLEDVPADVQSQLVFRFASTIEDVLAVAIPALRILRNPEKGKSAKSGGKSPKGPRAAAVSRRTERFAK